jgi:hypothetical protein
LAERRVSSIQISELLADCETTTKQADVSQLSDISFVESAKADSVVHTSCNQNGRPRGGEDGRCSWLWRRGSTIGNRIRLIARIPLADAIKELFLLGQNLNRQQEPHGGKEVQCGTPEEIATQFLLTSCHLTTSSQSKKFANVLSRRQYIKPLVFVDAAMEIRDTF